MKAIEPDPPGSMQLATLQPGSQPGVVQGVVAKPKKSKLATLQSATSIKEITDLIMVPECGPQEIALLKVVCFGLILYLACLIPVIIMSCVTTKTCDVGDVLGPTDYCKEYGPGENPILTGGDICTVVCGGKEANRRYYEPVLECSDGNLEDADTGTAVASVCAMLPLSLTELSEDEAMAAFAEANKPGNVLLTGKCVGATEREIPNINAAQPCLEGKFISPGKKCNVNCKSGYFPTVESQECRRPEMLLQPVHTTIQCLVQSELNAWRAEMRARPCFRDQHCNGKGVAIRNQVTLECNCACEPPFVGLTCEHEVRECLLPEIENAGKPPCQEGWTTYVRGPTCTVVCAQDYFPAIPVLRCTGSNLVPATGECRGGPMPPTVCVVATLSLSGLYVFFVVVVYGLYFWRNWRVKRDLTKIYAGDPKCTMVAEENHFSGGQTNVLKPSQTAKQYQKSKRERMPIHRTNEFGEVEVGGAEKLDYGSKSEEQTRRELHKLSELADLSRQNALQKDIPLVESAYMSAYEGFLVEENYESASKLVREGYLLEAELDQLEEERLVDDVLREKEKQAALEFDARNPVFQVEDHEDPDTLLLMAPTDQRYAVDHSGLPIRDPLTGGTDLRYQAPLVENAEVPSLAEQADWVNEFNKCDNETKSTKLQKEAVLEILERYENGKCDFLSIPQLEAAKDVLERAKAIADAVDCWPLNKRCRGMMKRVAELKQVQQEQLDEKVDLLMRSVASKNPEQIEAAIEETMFLKEQYPALIGRWHMVAQEVVTDVIRKAAKKKSQEEKEVKKMMGLIADYDIGPKEIVQAVKEKDVPKLRAGLNAFVSPNTRDPDTGMTLLHLAAINFDQQVFLLLIKKKADVNLLTSPDCHDVWDLASSYVRGFMKHKLKLKVPTDRVFLEDDEATVNSMLMSAGRSSGGAAESSSKSPRRGGGASSSSAAKSTSSPTNAGAGNKGSAAK
ncbi:unnamed protein product [Amoebophrya sp. A120]|nr:unnamed protein product [Amoebophrya sp. A120]|eukprot:GSA120T00019367001.1